ncbi:MAG: hypothetical protein IPK80_32295 [Nannocystis sp.]|jgi:hypothetical protein|nr:hypothetical protein [Nannocystis sp.]
MSTSVATAVTHALPALTSAATHPSIDLADAQSDLDAVAREILAARARGLTLLDAIEDPAHPQLRAFHQGIRDALFVELPGEFDPWIAALTGGSSDSAASGVQLQRMLVGFAQGRGAEDRDAEQAGLQAALAELLVFESIRLQLLVLALSTEDYELLGGEESDIDAIAWVEVQALLHRLDVDDPELRPVHLIHAAATVSLARDAAARTEELRAAGDDFREELRMRARLRAALRELRLPEAVLLENALSALLGGERRELTDLQAERPIALDGLSRQAMDQRVSRGRRALTRPRQGWPARRRPALFDLLRVT